ESAPDVLEQARDRGHGELFLVCLKRLQKPTEVRALLARREGDREGDRGHGLLLGERAVPHDDRPPDTTDADSVQRNAPRVASALNVLKHGTAPPCTRSQTCRSRGPRSG